MQCIIKINMDNAAFHENENGEELNRILCDTAEKIYGKEWHKGDSITLVDINGNNVGTCEFKRSR